MNDKLSDETNRLESGEGRRAYLRLPDSEACVRILEILAVFHQEWQKDLILRTVQEHMHSYPSTTDHQGETGVDMPETLPSYTARLRAQAAAESCRRFVQERCQLGNHAIGGLDFETLKAAYFAWAAERGAARSAGYPVELTHELYRLGLRKVNHPDYPRSWYYRGIALRPEGV